jgi:flavorubredoxin
MEEATMYYANILMPLSSLVARKIQEIVAMHLPIDMIAPSHGIIWRKDPMKIVNAYVDWSVPKTRNKVVIVFDTMWNSTDKMARAIADGVASQSVDVKILKMRSYAASEAMTELLDAKAVLVGSPTLNNGMFPTLSQFLTYAAGLKPKGKLWSFFGSYGWGGGAVRGMVKMAKEVGFDVAEPGLEIKFVPDEEDLKKCFEFGQQIAQKIKA